MLTVSELAKLAQVTPDAVRHYIHVGLITPEQRSEKGYRLFGEGDVKRVKFIRQAKELGFTLADIREIFDHSCRGLSPCPAWNIIRQRIDENSSRLAELNALQKRMNEALERWKTIPDGEPDDDAICYLIESVAEPIR